MRRLAPFMYAAALWMPVQACSCWRPSPEEYLSAASLVFRGTVLSVEEASAQAPLPPGAGSVTLRGRQSGMRAKFKIAVSFKGPVREEVEIRYTASDGANCGSHFSVGENVTVFASGSTKTGFTTSMCLMIPYDSHTRRGDNRYAAALDQYRTRRDAFLADLRKEGPKEEVLREQAAFFVRYKDLEDADDAFSHLLQRKPHDVAALVGRGSVRYAAARYDEALADYRAAIAVDPASSDARRGRTLSLVKLGRVQELAPDDRDFTAFNSGYGQRVSFANADLLGAKFRGATLNGVDFSGADLRGADFSSANLHTCNFSGARLAGAKFDSLKGSYNTTFQQATLEYSSFKGAHLFHVKLDGAVLDKADFSKARLESTSLENASVSGANFQGASLLLARLRGARWDGQDLAGVELRGADLRDAAFRNTSLRGAVFGHSYGSLEIMDLRGADFSSADLTDVKWGPAIVDCRTKLPRGLDLSNLPVLPLWSGCSGAPPKTALAGGHAFQRGPRLHKLEAPMSQLSEIDLSGFGFWQVRFDGSDFSRAKLIAIDIQGGSYAETNFKHAQLSEARISRANFKGSSLEHANLSGARLHEVDLTGAHLDQTKLTGTCYDSKTIWPEGFDPVAAGAKRC